MQEDLEQLKTHFTELFGVGPKIRDRARPGRVNLIGEHTDYNDGFVFPMAIEPEVRVVCRSRKDDIIRIASTVYPNEFVEFSLQKNIERGKPAWGNYVRGVAAELIMAGHSPVRHGRADLQFPAGRQRAVQQRRHRGLRRSGASASGGTGD